MHPKSAESGIFHYKINEKSRKPLIFEGGGYTKPCFMGGKTMGTDCRRANRIKGAFFNAPFSCLVFGERESTLRKHRNPREGVSI